MRLVSSIAEKKARAWQAHLGAAILVRATITTIGALASDLTIIIRPWFARSDDADE